MDGRRGHPFFVRSFYVVHITLKIPPIFALFQLRSFVLLRQQTLPIFHPCAGLFCSHSERICLAVLSDPENTILDLQKHVYQPSHKSCGFARSVVAVNGAAKYVETGTTKQDVQNALVSFKAKR
jgi:hypothetical protein